MKKIALMGTLVGFFFVPITTHADDLHYASVEDLQGGNILLEYRTTEEGDLYADCEIESAHCSDLSDEKGEAFDLPLGRSHTLSPDGSIAISKAASFGERAYWALYEIEGSHATFERLLEYNEQADGVSISYANDVAVFRTSDGSLVREDLTSGEVTETETVWNSFPYLSLSEHGTYASVYDAEEEEHMIWDLTGDTEYTIDADPASYVVYSDNEEHVAFLREVDGFNKLFVSEMDEFDEARDVSPGDHTVVEYEFIGNTLFFIANEEENPLQWNLYTYDLEDDETSILEEDVAYDDAYLNVKKTHDRIFYQVVEGKNRTYVSYKPETDERLAYDAAPETETSDEITRSVIEAGGRTAALLSPEDTQGDEPLIVWLHGGPVRQTSLRYHPFLGYAVYDDVLERLAHDAHVLKLDYTGSFGYGNEFQDALDGNMGIEDVADTDRALDDMIDELDTDDVYLMGNSYGGYLALKYLAEDPDRVDGAVSIAGVTDWYGLLSRIPSSPFGERFGGVPNDETFEKYVDASIYASLEDVDDDTPMLLAYGEDDATVPTWQSEEFVEFAEELGKNVELVAYEDEGHTILKRENLTDICERVADMIGNSDDRCRE